MEKLTIHRALAELKLIDSKINKKINEGLFIGVRQKGKLVMGRVSEDDFKSSAQGSYDSIRDLFARKSKVKSAISLSNTHTKVKIGEEEITVAEAIAFRQQIPMMRQFYDTLRSQINQAHAVLNKNNEQVEANLQKILEVTFGKDNTKIDKNDMENVSDPFRQTNTWELVDPLDIEKVLKQSEDRLATFEAEADAVLSEANAITFIEI